MSVLYFENSSLYNIRSLGSEQCLSNITDTGSFDVSSLKEWVSGLNNQ